VPFEKGAIRLGQTLGETADVDPLVDPVDPNPDVTNLDRCSLGSLDEFIGLQPRSIPIVVVREPPGNRVDRTARLNRKSPSEMSDRCLAALAVLTQQLPTAFRRATPTEVVAFYFANAHALTPDRSNDQRLRVDGNLDV